MWCCGKKEMEGIQHNNSTTSNNQSNIKIESEKSNSTKENKVNESDNNHLGKPNLTKLSEIKQDSSIDFSNSSGLFDLLNEDELGIVMQKGQGLRNNGSLIKV